jgi:hypothetical protein
MTPTKPMTNKEERALVIKLLPQFINSIRHLEEKLIILGKNTEATVKMYGYHSTEEQLQDFYYVKSLLDKRLGELKND